MVDVIKGQNKLDVDGCVFVCVSGFLFFSLSGTVCPFARVDNMLCFLCALTCDLIFSPVCPLFYFLLYSLYFQLSAQALLHYTCIKIIK